MNKNESVSFGVQLKEKEYSYFSLYSKYKIIIVMLICIWIISMVYFSILTEIPFVATILLSAGITLLVFLPLLFFLVVHQAKNNYKKDPALKENSGVEISNQGITLTTSDKDVLAEWKYFYSIKELKNLFILYYSSSKAIVLPKRVFHSKDDIELFKKLFLTNMIETNIHFKK